MSDLYKKYAFTFGARAAAALGLLLMNVVLGRTLGVEGFGLFSFGFIALMGFGVIVRFGHDNSLMKLGGIYLGQNRPECFRRLARRSIGFALVLGTATGGIVYMVARIMTGWGPLEAGYIDVLGVVAIAIVPFSLTYFVSALIKAAGKPEVAPFFEVGSASMFGALAILALGRQGVAMDAQTAIRLLAAICMVTSIVGIAFVYRVRPVSKSQSSGTDCRPENITGLNWSFFVMAAAGYLTQWFAPLILSYYSGAGSVGLYNAAYGLTLAVGFVLFVFNGILSPRIASAFAQNEIKTIEELFRKSTRMMVVVIAPIAAFFLLFPDVVLELYGEGYEGASGLMQLLTLAQVVNVSVGSVGLMLSMTGNEKEIRNIFVVSALFSVVASFLMVPFFAEWGTAIAVFLSLVFQNLFASYVVYKRLGITAYAFLLPKKHCVQ